MFDFNLSTIIGYLYALPGIFFALSVHEFSHGFVASKLGDPTAKNYGRLTLNPLKHIDLMGLIAMFIVGVGWAKPVPVDSRYFKNAKRDMALTALAGPVSNFISAFVGLIVLNLYVILATRLVDVVPLTILQGILYILDSFVMLNIGLAIFNLIPIPPLDGSRILDSFLSPKALLAYHKYEDIIRIVLLALLIFDIFSIAPAISFVYNLMDKLIIAVLRIFF